MLMRTDEQSPVFAEDDGHGTRASRDQEDRSRVGDDVSAAAAWICFSAQDWWYHNRAHSDFQLMQRIAERRRVIFVNSIGMRMPLPGRSSGAIRRVVRKARSILRSLQRPVPRLPGFYVYTPIILPFYGVAVLRAVNASLVRLQIRILAWKLGIPLEDTVVFLTIPTAVDVVEQLPRRTLIYNRSDMHSAFKETDQEYIRSLESRLLRNSELTVYVSHKLMEAELDCTGERAAFLDHGVDFQRFAADPGREPDELSAIPHPIVGFFGGIDDYVVDLELLESVARSLPNVSLVIIGDATCSMERLTRLPNVHWLGFRPYEAIPALGASFDVALMPWLRNEWIEHCNPIKMKEYLALGLPVVTTEFPEAHYYSDVLAIARTPDEFVQKVREALAGDCPGTRETRRARVADFTWDRQAERLLGLGEESA
jgi:glycosyltransferase involved in cell wall biosynthesis